MTRTQRIATAVLTFSALAVAAGAALFSVVLAAREGQAVRNRDRYVTWCEQPALVAIADFHQELIGPLEGSVRSDPDQATYQWQAGLVQSAVMTLQRKLQHGALSLGRGQLEGELVLSCQRMEDGVLAKLHDYAAGKDESIDVDKEVRRWSARVAEIVARGDPTWED